MLRLHKTFRRPFYDIGRAEKRGYCDDENNFLGIDIELLKSRLIDRIDSAESHSRLKETLIVTLVVFKAVQLV